MEDVEETFPHVEMDKMESAPYKTGIFLPHVLDPETQEHRGDEKTEYQVRDKLLGKLVGVSSGYKSFKTLTRQNAATGDWE
uniref:Uncharacterized protein n=1 Tax=Peronospora matthiolae TaxID=2874970 RepID=A0AAV1U3H4_9STRA